MDAVAASGGVGPAAKRPRLMEVGDSNKLCSPVTFTAVAPRPRMFMMPVRKEEKVTRSSAAAAASVAASIPVSRPPVMTHMDDYLALVGNMYYQAPETGKSTSSFALIRRTTLGLLTSPVREPSVLDRWSPYEIALFEASICIVGKQFSQISAAVGTKNTQDVVEFYYTWKKSKNYVHWKASFKQAAGETE